MDRDTHLRGGANEIAEQGSLTPEERSTILSDLSTKEDLVRTAMDVSRWSRTQVPDSKFPSADDMDVLSGRLPLDAASDRTLQHISHLTKAVEQAI